ncbi:MAG: MFS transporter [Oleiphilaceae bacterium]|nr:MFS transporter [Oleiphilaceae bacterium]
MLQVKLSVFYFAYFALLGVMAPYLGLFLESEGFSAAEIGQLTGLLMATKVIAPNVWGLIADRTQKRLLLIRLGAFLTLVSYLGFFFAESFWYYALMIIAFSFFWNAILAQFEVITLHNLGADVDRYSLVRVWGSIGFVVAVIALGYIFEERGVGLFPIALLIIMSGIALSTCMRFDEPVAQQGHEISHSLSEDLKRNRAYLFFVICFLLQFSHAAYYSYFSLYMEQLGYDKLSIGIFWALGVIAEVALFFVMHHWHRKHAVPLIMGIALLFSALRWAMIAGASEYILVLVIAQLLHAFSFGAMHAVSIRFVHEHFHAKNQGRAQALYSSLGFGLGGFVGAFVIAALVEESGYANLFWISSLIVCFALFVLSLFWTSFVRDHEVQ